jgi:hypothetical protein
MTRSRRGAHRAGALIAMLTTAGSTTVVAQRPSNRSEPAELQIRTSLRAFYFSLAHHDWEALADGILPAKVIAHHPAPAAIVAASQPHERPANCAPAIAERVEDAEITIDAGWAAASVAGCGTGQVGSGEPRANDAGADEFRFIEFDGRWWIVHIELSHDPGTLQLAR